MMGGMTVLQIALIAVSLALDACAVSVSCGISVRGFGWRNALQLGLWFGAFQFFMTVVGWLLGSSVALYIEAVDHWIAFGLLAIIGGRMVLGGLRGGQEDAPDGALTVRKITLLAVATSIDALAVGITLVYMDVNAWLAAGIIGGVAFVLSVLGGLAGQRLGGLFQRAAQAIGGLVLVGIGIKILVEHLQ